MPASQSASPLHSRPTVGLMPAMTVQPRILLLITDLQIGGTPTVVRELAIRLRAGGDVHVEVACLAPWGPVADQLAAAGVPVAAFGASSVTQIVGVVRKLIRLIDRQRLETVLSFLVHANAVAAAVSLLRPGVRWLQSIQTTQPYPRWHWWVQRVAALAAERVVVPSPSVAQMAQQRADVAADRIAVVPNAVQIEDTGWKPVPPQRGAVGFVGRLDPVKRVTDLIDAVAMLDRPVHLHIYGEGRDRARIEAHAARLGAGDCVTLHGAVLDARPAIAGLDVLVLPSEAEGFGLVLIEAMAVGVPVVATDAPGIRDVVTHGVTGLLVPVGRPDALATAIDRVLSDDVLRASLTSAALADVRQRFTWDGVLPRYRQLLRL